MLLKKILQIILMFYSKNHVGIEKNIILIIKKKNVLERSGCRGYLGDLDVLIFVFRSSAMFAKQENVKVKLHLLKLITHLLKLMKLLNFSKFDTIGIFFIFFFREK